MFGFKFEMSTSNVPKFGRYFSLIKFLCRPKSVLTFATLIAKIQKAHNKNTHDKSFSKNAFFFPNIPMLILCYIGTIPK